MPNTKSELKYFQICLRDVAQFSLVPIVYAVHHMLGVTSLLNFVKWRRE